MIPRLLRDARKGDKDSALAFLYEMSRRDPQLFWGFLWGFSIYSSCSQYASFRLMSLGRGLRQERSWCTSPQFAMAHLSPFPVSPRYPKRKHVHTFLARRVIWPDRTCFLSVAFRHKYPDLQGFYNPTWSRWMGPVSYTLEAVEKAALRAFLEREHRYSAAQERLDWEIVL